MPFSPRSRGTVPGWFWPLMTGLVWLAVMALALVVTGRPARAMEPDSESEQEQEEDDEAEQQRPEPQLDSEHEAETEIEYIARLLEPDSSDDETEEVDGGDVSGGEEYAELVCQFQAFTRCADCRISTRKRPEFMVPLPARQ